MRTEYRSKSLHNSPSRGRPRARVIRYCAVPECGARAYKNNPYCPVCTRRAERHGDPTIVLKRGRKAKG
jgi:hypothetical protein